MGHRGGARWGFAFPPAFAFLIAPCLPSGLTLYIQAGCGQYHLDSIIGVQMLTPWNRVSPSCSSELP